MNERPELESGEQAANDRQWVKTATPYRGLLRLDRDGSAFLFSRSHG